MSATIEFSPTLSRIIKIQPEIAKPFLDSTLNDQSIELKGIVLPLSGAFLAALNALLRYQASEITTLHQMGHDIYLAGGIDVNPLEADTILHFTKTVFNLSLFFIQLEREIRDSNDNTDLQSVSCIAAILSAPFEELFQKENANSNQYQ